MTPKETPEIVNPRKDAINLLREMQQLRERAKISELEDEQKNRYLELAENLSETIDLLKRNEIDSRVSSLLQTLQSNQNAQQYDPRQDGFWIRENPKFLSTLEDLLIYTAGEGFETFEAKHHILQAVRYTQHTSLNAVDLKTILPFQQGASVKQGLWEKFVGVMAGESFQYEPVDKYTVRVTGDLSSLAQIMPKLKELGYREIECITPLAHFERLKENFNDAYLKEEIPKERKEPSKAVKNLIKYTRPISSIITSNLPLRLKERVYEAQGKYKQRDRVSTEVIGGIGFNLIVGVALATGGFGTGNPIIGGIGAYLVAETIYKVASSKDSDPCLKGTAFFKIPLYPLEVYVKSKNELGNLVRIGIPLLTKEEQTQTPQEKENNPNTLPFYEEISLLGIPRNIEESLESRVGNFNGYGSKFLAHLKKELGAIPKGVNIIPQYNNGRIVFTNQQKIEENKREIYRTTYLICSPEKRTIVTTLSDNSTGEEAFLLQEKVESLTAETIKSKSISPLRFVRVRNYENGVLKSDTEVLA